MITQSRVNPYPCPLGSSFFIWADILRRYGVSIAIMYMPSFFISPYIFLSRIYTCRSRSVFFATQIPSNEYKFAANARDKRVHDLIAVFHPISIEIAAIRFMLTILTIFVLDPENAPLRIFHSFICCLFKIFKISFVHLEVF